MAVLAYMCAGAYQPVLVCSNVYECIRKYMQACIHVGMYLRKYV